MPPKKSTKPVSKEAPKKPASRGKPASKASPKKEQEAETAKAGAKRKHSPDAETTPSSSSASLKAIVSFLKDDASTKFASSRPDQPNLFDHMDASAKYTPWQNLVACVVMSKPISSRLGVRTLRTLFEDKDIDYTTPEKMKEAGGDARYQALDKSKTQHKDKTSLQLGRLAETVLEKYSAEEGDTSLSKLRDEIGGSSDNLNKVIKGFYGFGDTASDIFRRRMQADWDELYPFMDERAMNAAGHLGLADESAEALAQQVKELSPSADKDAERAQFARIVDALVAVDLEHRYEDLLEQIGETELQDKKAKVE